MPTKISTISTIFHNQKNFQRSFGAAVKQQFSDFFFTLSISLSLNFIDRTVAQLIDWNFFSSFSCEVFACNMIVVTVGNKTDFVSSRERGAQRLTKNRYELILCSFTTKSFSVSTSLIYLVLSSLGPRLTAEKHTYLLCVCVCSCFCVSYFFSFILDFCVCFFFNGVVVLYDVL